MSSSKLFTFKDKNLTCQHLEDAQQTYFEHMGDALSYAGKSASASAYFFIHALFPCLLTDAGSSQIGKLNQVLSAKHDEMLRRKFHMQYEPME